VRTGPFHLDRCVPSRVHGDVYVVLVVGRVASAATHGAPALAVAALVPDVLVPDHVVDAEAPGVVQYRMKVEELLKGLPVRSRPHEKIISDIDEAGKTFHVLVLKTNMTIPYTSVFLRLDCKYWSAEQEKNLRSLMQTSPHK